MRLREKCDCSSENVELKNDSYSTTDGIEMIGHLNQRLPYNYHSGNQCLPATSSTTGTYHSRKLLPLVVVDSPRHFGRNCHVKGATSTSVNDCASDSAATPTSAATSVELADELPSRNFDDLSFTTGIDLNDLSITTGIH
jgi:hypothetical protein